MADKQKIAELYIAVTADTTAATKGLDAATASIGKLAKSASSTSAKTARSWEQIGSSFISAGKGITKAGEAVSKTGAKMTAAVTIPLVAAGTAAVGLASDYEETLNKVGETFGKNAEAVKEWANSSIESMGLAKATALDMAALFGDLGSGMGIAGQKSVEMSTSLVQLAADMASFKNVSVERAQTALAGVYTGETEALKSLGVVMTQANLKEYARAQGIEKTLDKMSQAELVQLRYQYVLQATANAQGDFARTSDGFANQTRMLQERVKELGVELGQKLMPVAEKLLDWANDLLDQWSGLDEETQDLIIKLAGFAAACGPVLTVGGKLLSGVGKLTQGLGSLMGGKGLDGLAGQTLPKVTAAFKAAGSATGIYALGAAALVGAVTAVHEGFDGTAVDNMLIEREATESLSQAAQELAARYTELSGTQMEAAEGAAAYGELQQQTYEQLAQITAEIEAARAQLAQAQQDAEAGVQGAQGDVLDLQVKIETLEEAQASLSRTYVNSTVDLERYGATAAEYAAQQDAATAATEALEQREADLAATREARNKRLEELNAAIAASYEKMRGKVSNVFGRIEKDSTVSVGSMIKNLESSTQTATQWADDLDTLAARGLDEGLLQQLRDAGPEAAGSVAELVSASDDELAKLEVAFRDSTQAAARAAAEEIGKSDIDEQTRLMVEKAADTIRASDDMADAAVDMVDDAGDAAAATAYPAGSTAGSQYVAGLVSGINRNKSRATSAARQLAADVQSHAQWALQIRSPSKKAEWMMSQWVAGGVQGIERNQDDLIQATGDLALHAVLASADVVQSAGADALPGHLLGLPPAPVQAAESGQAIVQTLELDGEAFGRIITRLADAGLGDKALNTSRLGVTLI